MVVVGAGIGGLGSALALARSGHRVTIIERDDTPMPADIEGAFEWDRRGAPQVRHPHVFLGLARTILRDRFPDVLAALGAIGVEPTPMRSNRGFELDEATLAVIAADDDLRMLPCRRTTFEWLMRRVVLDEPSVSFLVGRGVAGVEVGPGPGGGPVVTGIRLDDDAVLQADLVVATTGRRGDVPAWLAAHGIQVPETASEAGVVYFSRFYRSSRDEQFGFRGGFGAGLIAGVIGADAGTYSITAVVDRSDKELRAHLSDSDRFDATMRLLPELADVAEVDGVPIHPVHYMTGLINRTRSFTTADGEPRLTGLIAVGDAHTCTNPAYGRGQSLALRQATYVADAVAAHDNLLDAARDYEARSSATVEPWYHFSVLTDSMRSAAASDGASTRGAGLDFGALFGGGAVDPELVRMLLRVLNLLELPQTLIAKLPELTATAATQPRAARASVPRIKRPSRDELLAAIA
ncbi:MAG TPA: FAD-dependent oxidoreductase [Acidimicrobiales bacterium]|nr:FAD-dependent oxidoreductase [Acidimicrobiales bacterium]